MNQPSRRRARSALAAGAASAVLGASVAACTPEAQTFELVNLGDSYSAAIGTGAPTASSLRPTCFQGPGPDHVTELASHPRVELLLNAACSGLDSAGLAEIVELPEVAESLADADVVTLTIGGNDVAWVETILACSSFSADAACESALSRVGTEISAGAEAAGRTLAKIAAATPGRILMLGYPQLLHPDGAGLPITGARAAQLNSLTDELNAALATAAEANGADFVDVTERFTGHGLGSDEPWINLDLRAPGDASNLHPNTDGYVSGYFPAIAAALELEA